MRRETFRKLILGTAKLAGLAVLILMGIIFVPDGFITRVERGIDSAVNFVRQEAAEKAPGMAQGVVQKFNETKVEAEGLFNSFKSEQYPRIRDWIAGIFEQKKP